MQELNGLTQVMNQGLTYLLCIVNHNGTMKIMDQKIMSPCIYEP